MRSSREKLVSELIGVAEASLDRGEVFAILGFSLAALLKELGYFDVVVRRCHLI